VKKKRKLTQEKVDAINRKRDLIEGTEKCWEAQHLRVELDPETGRGVIVDQTQARC